LMDTIGNDAIKQAVQGSELHGKYSETVDRESAYEQLMQKVAPPQQEQAPEAPPQRQQKEEPGLVEKVLGNSAVKSFLRSAGSALAREITRGIFGTSRKRR
jgi:hypothetical protein